MSEDINIQQVSLHFTGIDLLDFKLVQLEQPVQEFKSFSFNISMEQRIAHEQKLVLVVATILVTDKPDGIVLGSVKTCCIFEVGNMEDFMDPASKVVTLPEMAVTTLNSLSISTSRGIMYGLFKGTFLHAAFLPIIDPKSFQKQELQK
jgi:hypothetical protein